MLAGMGGVSYHRARRGRLARPAGSAAWARRPWASSRWARRSRQVRELTAKPFGVDLLTAAPGDMEAKVNDIIDGGAPVFVAGLGVPRDVVDLCHRQQRARGQHVRQGPPRHRRGRGRLRHRRRPGHRGRRTHRPGRHHGARAPDRRRRRRPGAGRRRRRPRSTGAGWPPRSRSAPTASGSAPASSPRPRPTASPGYKEALLAHRRGRHGRHPGLHRQDLPGRRATTTPRPSTTHGGEPRAVPDAGRCSRCRTAPTTSAATSDTTDVDPDREFWPAGQGVGAIDELVPAGELVAPVRAPRPRPPSIGRPACERDIVTPWSPAPAVATG